MYIATAQLGLFRLAADATNAAVPLLRDVRRAVAGAGDPHLMVALRLHFARVEASRRSPKESERHLNAADDLLRGFPNEWLQGRVHLGLSIVSTLTGDLRRAIEQARLAIACAARSGHSRTELAGLINLSHALQGVGELDDAEQAINRVLTNSRQDAELTIAALDSRVNLLMRQKRFNEARALIREIDSLMSSIPPELHTRWAAFTLTDTRVRLLQAEERWDLADSELTNAITATAEKHDSYWENRFLLRRLQGFVAMERLPQASEILARLDEPDSLDALEERNRIVGSAVIKAGRSDKGREFVRRGRRIAETESKDMKHLSNNDATEEGASGYPRTTTPTRSR